jgi:hypothetical protein
MSVSGLAVGVRVGFSVGGAEGFDEAYSDIPCSNGFKC